MVKKEAMALLEVERQEKFLNCYKSLPKQESIGRQILSLDFPLIRRMRQQILERSPPKFSYHPIQNFHVSGSDELKKLGIQHLKQRKCAAVLAAGGQGSRLFFSGPKGCFPVSVIQKKSCYQIFVEKCHAASKQIGEPLEMAIMTSESNHAETIAFFIENNFFNIPPSQLSFFMQPSWPVLDFEGNLFLENPEKIATGPNGNGAMFSAFLESGIYQNWKEKGIEAVFFTPIDNPLSDPYDTEMLGFHFFHKKEVSIKAIERKSVHENLGLLVERDDSGKICIIEYSEMSEDDKNRVDKDGSLLFKVANISNFCFSMPFIEKAALMDLPLHPAKKSLKCLTSHGKSHFPSQPNGWKFEQFIFDALTIADDIGIMMYPREDAFAPLKNFQGEDSITTVQAALQESDKKAFEKATGTPFPLHETLPPFELSLEFHYPTAELLQKWKGKSFPNEEYIEE